MDDAVRVIMAAFALVIGLMIGLTVVDAITQTQAGGSEEEFRQESVEISGLQFTKLEPIGSGTNETVFNSRGLAVNLTGNSDSYVESDSNIVFSEDDTWTVSTWANVDSASANSNMTVLTIGGRLTITYNGTNSEWRAWYYDSESGNSHQVTIAAPKQPGNFSQIMVQRDGSQLTIYRNATPGATTTLTSGSAIDAPLQETNFDGRLDETRTWDDVLDSTERNDTVTAPNDPVPDNNVSSRIMYDEDGASTQPIYFTASTLLVSNGSYSSGLAGEQLEEKTLVNDIAGTSDYVWEEDGPRIRAVSGGQLDGSPVVYVDYDYSTAAVGVINSFGDMVSLAILAALVAIMGVILGRIRSV